MGVPVASFDDFDRQFRQLAQRKRLFAFLLHDSIRGQKSVAAFIEEQHQWLDELARGARIVFFFPLRRKGRRFENPSVRVAAEFGLKPGRLPGVILFAPPQEPTDFPSKQAVFLPLKSSDFSDPSKIEPWLRGLFGEIQAAMAGSEPSHQVLVDLKSRVSALRRKRGAYALARQIREGAHIVLIRIPEKLLVAMAEGFGKAFGGSATAA